MDLDTEVFVLLSLHCGQKNTNTIWTNRNSGPEMSDQRFFDQKKVFGLETILFDSKTGQILPGKMSQYSLVRYAHR